MFKNMKNLKELLKKQKVLRRFLENFSGECLQKNGSFQKAQQKIDFVAPIKARDLLLWRKRRA